MVDLDSAPDDDILARTICGEARGEGPQGMQAVANVVMNRAAKPGWWGSDIKSVCLKPYQFSCWLLSDPNRAVILNLDDTFSIFRAALDIAQHVIAGTLPDITDGATSYYATSMPSPPDWAAGKTPCATIGNQLFFTV